MSNDFETGDTDPFFNDLIPENDSESPFNLLDYNQAETLKARAHGDSTLFLYLTEAEVAREKMERSLQSPNISEEEKRKAREIYRLKQQDLLDYQYPPESS